MTQVPGMTPSVFTHCATSAGGTRPSKLCFLSIPLAVPHNVQLTVMLIYKDGKCIPELPNICDFYNFLHIFPPSMNLIFTTVMSVFSVTFIQFSFYAFCTLCRSNILIIVLIQIHLKFYSVFSTLYWRKHT